MKKRFLLWLVLLLSFNTLSLKAQLGLQLNTEDAYNGYTLFIGGGSSIYLVDNCGEYINSWTSPFNTGLTAYLTHDGHMIRAIQNSPGNSLNGAGAGGAIEMQDWEGNIVWNYSVSVNNEYLQHHDIEYLPNGNVLALCWKSFSATQMSLVGGNQALNLTYVIEIEPSGYDEGEIVWEWSLYDRFIQDQNASLDNFALIADHPERFNIDAGTTFFGGDYAHCNSVDYIEEFDMIVLSSLTKNELWVIDHSTTTAEARDHQGGNYGKGGDFLYRWGNPSMYDHPGQAQFDGQHDVSWVATPEEEFPGFFTIYNNGFNGKLDIVIPPMNPDGSFNYSEGVAYGPESADWSYTTGNFSGIGCSHRRLENGNSLWCDSFTGEMKEVNDEGVIVWHYQNPVNTAGPQDYNTDPGGGGGFNSFGSFRAEKYGPDFSGFDGKELIPQGVIELNAPVSDCEIFALMDTITEPVDTTNMDTTMVHILEGWMEEKIEIYPIPSNRFIYLNGLDRGHSYRIANINGQIVDEGMVVEKIDIKDFEPGTYFLQLKDSKNQDWIKFVKVNF